MRILAFLLGWVCALGAARATTVIPPTFDSLVDDAELVFRGRVIATKSDWSGTGPKRRIATWVTFAVERTLRGEAEPTLTLEFAGGEVDGRRLDVAGWPRFAVGDHGVFFVENRRARLCPLKGVRHGRYRIVADPGTGREHVLRDDYSPLRMPAEVGRPLAAQSAAPAAAAPGAGLALVQFESLVTARSAQVPVPDRSRR